MGKRYILIITFFISINVLAQETDFSNNWKNILIHDQYFTTLDLDDYLNLDLSPAISNKDFSGYSLQTYTGVFGPLYRRIDFFFEAMKDTNNQTIYHIIGKNKLNKNIRPISGTLKLLEVRKQSAFPELNYPYMAIFEFNLKEPSTKSGDGEFTGIASILFFNNEDGISWYLSDGGDFNDYSNVFVGVWKRYNSKTSRKCIFAYDVIDIYFKLPFCNDFYINPDPEYEHEYKINEKFYPYGWSDFYMENKKVVEWWK